MLIAASSELVLNPAEQTAAHKAAVSKAQKGKKRGPYKKRDKGQIKGQSTIDFPTKVKHH